MIKLISLIKEEIVDDVLNKITDLPLDKFVDKFKDIASHPKVQAAIKAGKTDGKPNDEKVSFIEKYIPVVNLLPTQNVIGFDESLKNILTDSYGQLEMFLKGGNIIVKTSIVTLNSKWIIDGHHRWSQLYIANPTVSIRSLDFRSTLHPENMLKAVHMAIAADLGELPLADAKGKNLIYANEKQIKSYVQQIATDKVVNLFFKYKKIADNSKDSLSNYIWENVVSLQTNNKPKSWAVDRDVMPQTSDSDQYQRFLNSGMVNFIEPKQKDISN